MAINAALNEVTFCPLHALAKSHCLRVKSSTICFQSWLKSRFFKLDLPTLFSGRGTLFSTRVKILWHVVLFSFLCVGVYLFESFSEITIGKSEE